MKICIDPGHGGTDPGAVNGSRYKKTDVLKLAKEISHLLEKQGIEVLLTRDTDKAIRIADRCELANKAGCNYFLSLHRDAAAPSATGVTIYVHSTANEPTTKKAQAILDEVLKVTPVYNRGVRKGSAQGYENYGVNVYTTMASALLELGFITNSQDNQKFDDYFTSYAKAIAKGLCGAVGEEYQEGASNPSQGASTPSDTGTTAPNGMYRVYKQAGAFTDPKNAKDFAVGQGGKTIIIYE